MRGATGQRRTVGTLNAAGDTNAIPRWCGDCCRSCSPKGKSIQAQYLSGDSVRSALS